MNLKLFTVMGISWLLEIISTFYKHEIVEYILDTYNLFLGVFIFFIFVFKRKVLYELKCRFGEWIPYDCYWINSWSNFMRFEISNPRMYITVYKRSDIFTSEAFSYVRESFFRKLLTIRIEAAFVNFCIDLKKNLAKALTRVSKVMTLALVCQPP